MSVVRVNKSKNYTVMSNYHLRDKNLSLKAKGLLSIMLSLPEDWDYSIKGLVAICKEGETAVKSTLDELKEYGYLTVTKIMPSKENGGKYEYIYDIYEQPHENQEIENQEVENQGVGFLGVENHPLNKYSIYNNSNNLYNTTYIDKSNNITNKQNKDKTKENKKRNRDSETIKEIVEYLNKICGTNYRPSADDTIRHINARLKEGRTIDDFKKVIDVKHDEWKNTDWEKYLRPKTLFGTKFESYLNQKKRVKEEELTAVERVKRGIK